MSGGKKTAKKKVKKIVKKHHSEANAAEDGAEAAKAAVEEAPAKTKAVRKKRIVKKKSEKEAEGSVKSAASDGASSKSSKSSKKTKKTTKRRKVSSTPQTSDRKLPPAEHVSSLKIPAFPEIEYQNVALQSGSSLDFNEIISNASDNAQYIIPAGSYSVELVIQRPISLIAQGEVIFLSPGTGHTITIQSQGVSIKGVKICQKYSEIHSAVNVEQGSVRLSDCVLYSEYAPALLATGCSITHIKGSQILSTKAPPIFATDTTLISIDKSEIKDSSSTGIILCGETSAKISKSLVACHEKSGIICRDKSRMFLEQCQITGCGKCGIEIGSTSQCVQLNNCTIDGCGCSGISIYGLATASIQQSTFSNCTGPAIDFSGGCGVLLTDNKFDSCGTPALLYLQENATVESTNDSFFSSADIGCALLNNGELTMTNPTFDSLNVGVSVNDEGTFTLNNGKFMNILTTSVSAVGETTINITGSSFVGSGETGILLNKAKSFVINSSVIEKCGFSAIDANSCSELNLTNTTLSNNRNAGLVCTGSPANIIGGQAIGNGIAAYEFRGCKGTMKETTISENACGIVCVDKGSVSIEKSTLSGNKQSAVLLISKSAATLRHVILKENGVLASGKSIAKLRASELTSCKNGVQITGEGTTADIEGTTFTSCKCGILVAESAQAVTEKTQFNENNLGIEVRLGSSLKCKGDIHTKGKGEASVVVMSKCEATLNKINFTQPGECGIYCENAAKLLATELTITNCQAAGIVAQQCDIVEVTGGTYNQNGRAAVILSGTGQANISSISATQHIDAAILVANGSEPHISQITADGAESVAM